MPQKRRPIKLTRKDITHFRFNQYMGTASTHSFYQPFPVLQIVANKIRRELRLPKPDLSKLKGEVKAIEHYVKWGRQTREEWEATLRSNKLAEIEIPDFVREHMERVFPLRMMEMQQLLKNIESRKKKK